MCPPTTLNQAAYRGQPPASWETISLLAANLSIINFDILLKGGGIISYLGLDTIFLSDLNLEMWGDRVGTLGGQVGGDTKGSPGWKTDGRPRGKGKQWGVPRKVVLGYPQF